MKCRNGDCPNQGKPYAYGLGTFRRTTSLCDSCAAKLSAIGMSLRAETETPDTRPRWLRGLKAKDYSGTTA